MGRTEEKQPKEAGKKSNLHIRPRTHHGQPSAPWTTSQPEKERGTHFARQTGNQERKIEEGKSVEPNVAEEPVRHRESERTCKTGTETQNTNKRKQPTK